MVLFHSLLKSGTKRNLVAMYRNLSENNIARLRRLGVTLIPNNPLDIMFISSDEGMEERDQKLFSKLRVWELVEYTKVVQMDSDMVVLKNIDELFRLPEITASAMSDTDEKIIFFERAGVKLSDYIRLQGLDSPRLLPGWSGLNSGIVVLKPSLETFHDMMQQLSQYPKRVCCPSQEFIYNYFEQQGGFFRLPLVYNTRRLSNLDIGDPRQLKLLLPQAKVFHYVFHVKPWSIPPGEQRVDFVEHWWKLSEEVDKFLIKEGLGIVEADPGLIRRT